LGAYVDQNTVKLGFKAPMEVVILREELVDGKKYENY